MNKTKVRGYKVAASLILAIILFGALFATPINAAESLDAKIFVSYDFQEDFDMIFNCKVYTKGDFDSVKLSVVFDGKTEVLTVPESYDASTGFCRYVFRGVSAAEMTSIAKATLIATAGNTEYRSDVKQACIKDYAMALINYYDDKYYTDSNAKKLCTAYVDMLNYGAAAQKYFGKNTSNLANKDLTSAQQKMASSLPTSASSCYNKKDLSNATAEIQKIALSFENPVDLVVYSSFSSAPGSGVSAQVSYTDSNKTIKVPSSAFEYQQNDNLYRVEFKDIPLDSLTTPLTVVFKNDTKDISATITYSCESYAKSILGGDYDANVKDLVKKMLAYGYSAKAYAATLPTGCVTYRQFGAMGIYDESKTDNFEDYYPLIMTHDYANLKNLPVKADEGAHYYAKNMNPRSYKGALIKTDTDWGEANFTIDDKVLGTASVGKPLRNIQFSGSQITEGHCFLFTVEPSKPFEYKYSNPARYIYLGLDADLSTMIPEYPEQNDANARKLKNKTFPKGTTMLEGDFKDKALYILTTQSAKRWARNDKGVQSGIDQQEVIVINKTVTGNDGKKYGVVDEATPIEWDWQEIYGIHKYYIDENKLYVTGGIFNTIVNTEKREGYIYRGISVERSNVVVDGVKHYLKGEEANFPNNCYSSRWKRNVARSGAPYYGFIYLDHCAYVTIKNCRFTDHLRGWFLASDDSRSTAPYDFTAEQCAAITLDGCECLPTSVGENGYYVSDPTGIMDNVVRWGTMGTNYLKTFTVKNCKLSRVDAHKGVYNLTVTDSELGILGIAAVGFGTMRVERVLSHAVNFISLRRDFGSAWFGDIEVNDCTWDITNNSINPFFETMYDPTVTYCYDTVEKGGKTYYSQLPTNVTINNFTVDASKLGKGDGFYDNGISIFDKVIFKTDKIDEDYLSNPYPRMAVQYWAMDRTNLGYPYYYPIKAPEHVTVNNVHVINSFANEGSKISGVGLRVPGAQDMYFFTKEYDKTEFKWNNVVTYSLPGQN